jgi:hypothetical protein
MYSTFDKSSFDDLKKTPRWSDLMFLRKERDATLKSLSYYGYDDGDLWIESMIDCEQSAYLKKRADLFDRHFHHSLDICAAICLRVGRLEREAAGQHIEDYRMAGA